VSYEHISRILTALRDVSGVHGSFVLRLNGELVGNVFQGLFVV
jgi:hypothetical protein